MIENVLPIILYVDKIKSLQFLLWFYHDIQTPLEYSQTIMTCQAP